MYPQYVQTASLQPVGSQHRVNFVNLSSQQLNPGNLVQFHVDQARSMQPMPFTVGDIQMDRSGVARLDSEANNVSNLPRANTLPSFFAHANPDSKDAKYRTPEARTWQVPDHLLEARATDMF